VKEEGAMDPSCQSLDKILPDPELQDRFYLLGFKAGPSLPRYLVWNRSPSEPIARLAEGVLDEIVFCLGASVVDSCSHQLNISRKERVIVLVDGNTASRDAAQSFDEFSCLLVGRELVYTGLVSSNQCFPFSFTTGHRSIKTL
jgi:hypothetical protein